MKLGLVLVATALLAWCAVDVDGRPQPGTTGGKHNEDLDGIGDDLEDFLKHRDENNNHRLSDSQSVLQTNRNTKKPSSSGSGSDLLSDLLKFGQGGGGLGSLGSLGGLTRPSNPSTSVQYPSRPASPPASAPASPQYPSRASAPASPSRTASVPSYPSRPASVPSYPSYPTGAGQGSLYPQVPQVPAGGGWVAPSGGSTAPKKQGGGASYPSYPVSNYPSYPASNYPSYPSYTNYQRGSPNPYPGYQQPTYQQPAYQQPAAYPGYQQTYPGYQTVQRYDPRNPPPPQKKEGTSVTKSVSNFFKKIFS